MLGVGEPKRERAAVQEELHGIPPQRPAQALELGALDQTHDHEPLNAGLAGVYRVDSGAVASFKVGQRQPATPFVWKRK